MVLWVTTSFFSQRNAFSRQGQISENEGVEIVSDAESGERTLKLQNAKNFVGLSFNVLLQADRTAGVQTSASLTFPSSEVFVQLERRI